MPERSVTIRGKTYGGKELFFIAGPCVIESREHCRKIGAALAEAAGRLRIPLIFKASYDKANRTAGSSFRGVGIDDGLKILDEVRQLTGLPILTDVHDVNQARQAAEVVDVLQIPAFLCRQTDLILEAAGAAARTGAAVNIKKGQFLSPWEMQHPVQKAHSAGARNLVLTERGTTFGYNNLVVDFRAIPMMQAWGHPVVLDVTHSLQLPGGAGTASSGMAEYIPQLARAGVGAGVDGLFFEVHDNPQMAKSDGANALELDAFGGLVQSLVRIREACS
jgi:2-dehydro-3-deoxyphosphooctonate aldolase (KDO 8-P synthase)